MPKAKGKQQLAYGICVCVRQFVWNWAKIEWNSQKEANKTKEKLCMSLYHRSFEFRTLI